MTTSGSIRASRGAGAIKHKDPGIHVCIEHEQSCSIAFGTGLVLGGHIPGRALRVFCEMILSNKDLRA